MGALAVVLALLIFELASVSGSPSADENQNIIDLPKYINNSGDFFLVELDEDDNADDQILPENKTNMFPIYLTGPLNNLCLRSFKNATELFYAERFDDAIYNLNDIINNCSDLAADALYNRGYIEYKKGDYEKAKLDFKRALTLNKKSADCWFFLGKIMFGEGDLEDALSAINNSININPDLSYAINLRDQVLESLGT